MALLVPEETLASVMVKPGMLGAILLSPSGDPVSLRAVGFYQPPRIAELLGGVVVGQDTFDATFPRAQNGYTLLAGNPTKAGLAKGSADGVPKSGRRVRDKRESAGSSRCQVLRRAIGNSVGQASGRAQCDEPSERRRERAVRVQPP